MQPFSPLEARSPPLQFRPQPLSCQGLEKRKSSSRHDRKRFKSGSREMEKGSSIYLWGL